MIKMTYDIQVDAMMVQLRSAAKGTHVTTTTVAPGVHVDFDEHGHVLGLEVLDASFHLPRQTLEALPSPKEYLTLKQAAKESHLSEVTLRAQIRNGRIAAVKRGRDWFVDATALLNYLESRDTRGRPPTKRAARKRPAAKSRSTRARRAA